jgi:hypothetical protein
VRNAKGVHELWENICTLHEGTKSEREERYHIALKKINSFEMLPKKVLMTCTLAWMFL